MAKKAKAIKADIDKNEIQVKGRVQAKQNTTLDNSDIMVEQNGR